MAIIMDYIIKHVQTESELDSALELNRRVFGFNVERENSEYTRDKWVCRMRTHGGLMLYAETAFETVAIVFGRLESEDCATVGPVATDERFRGRGIARALMLELEKRAKAMGIRKLTLGAAESAEGFYTKLDYAGSLLIQSEKHTIEELLAFNTEHSVIYTNVWGGTVSQVCLAVDKPDRALQRRYERELGDCRTQMIFNKNI